MAQLDVKNRESMLIHSHHYIPINGEFVCDQCGEVETSCRIFNKTAGYNEKYFNRIHYEYFDSQSNTVSTLRNLTASEKRTKLARNLLYNGLTPREKRQLAINRRIAFWLGFLEKYNLPQFIAKKMYAEVENFPHKVWDLYIPVKIVFYARQAGIYLNLEDVIHPAQIIQYRKMKTNLFLQHHATKYHINYDWIIEQSGQQLSCPASLVMHIITKYHEIRSYCSGKNPRVVISGIFAFYLHSLQNKVRIANVMNVNARSVSMMMKLIQANQWCEAIHFNHWK